MYQRGDRDSGILIWEPHKLKGAWLSSLVVSPEELQRAFRMVLDFRGTLLYLDVEIVQIVGIEGYGEYNVTTRLNSAEEFLEYYKNAIKGCTPIDYTAPFEENCKIIEEMDRRRLEVELGISREV